MELEEPLLRWLTHMFGKFMQTVRRMLQFLTAWSSPRAWLGVLTTWQLAPPPASELTSDLIEDAAWKPQYIS